MMRSLIAEDEFSSRNLLARVLLAHGSCDVASDGREAVTAFAIALQSGTPYRLVCLDVMMPNMGGQDALDAIRELERQAAVPSTAACTILMTSASDDARVIMGSFTHQCDGYLVKPITKKKIDDAIERIGVPQSTV